MLFRMLYDDKLAQASYLIGCQRTGEALIIDPERDVDRYIDLAKQQNMRITAIAETHIHADFLSGARELAERTDARLFLSDEGDAEWKYQWLDKKQDGGDYDHQLLKDGDTFRVGNIQIQAVHTPGHTPEHLSFLVTDLGGGASVPIGIATGDFVFVGDVGRPDLLESAAGQAGAKNPSARRLYQSLQAFKALPDFVQVWPGHGAGSACGKALGAVPQSTVGYEKRFNASLAAADDEERFVETILSGQPDPPVYFARMKHENKTGPALLGVHPKPKPLDENDLKRLTDAGTEVVVLDTRPWAQFRDGHLPGALHAPLTNAFPMVAGSYVQTGTPIYLIVEETRVAEAVTDLIRIGLDEVAGYATYETLDRFHGAGGAVETTPGMAIGSLSDMVGDSDAVILDVRNESEYQAGHIPGAMNIPYTRLLARIDEVPSDQPLLVHCRTSNRSAYATAMLQRYGRKATQLIGGYDEWVKGRGGQAV